MSDNDRKDDRDPKRGDEDAISRNLKRAYDQVASEPLPDALASLLDKLRQGGQGGQTG